LRGVSPSKLPQYFRGRGKFKRGEASLFKKQYPPLLAKERGIKGVRLVNNLIV